MSDFGHRLLLVELLALVLRDACGGFSLGSSWLFAGRCAIRLGLAFLSCFGVFCFRLSRDGNFNFCLGSCLLCLLCLLVGLWSGIDGPVCSRSD